MNTKDLWEQEQRAPEEEGSSPRSFTELIVEPKMDQDCAETTLLSPYLLDACILSQA